VTSGNIATCLGAGPDAVEWFAGGIVAYQTEVKVQVLGLDEDCPIVSAECAECAEQLATGALRLFGVEVAVSATGVGGPEPSEGSPPGMVYLAVVTPEDSVVQRHSFDGEPDEVRAQTASAALTLLEGMVRDGRGTA